MNGKVLHTPLGDIEYCAIGTGIPVVFVHGGHSNCQETLCHKGFDLKKFQLITPSRPGYGKTPLSGNRTPRKSADLIAALLSVLSLSRIIVYGISAGGLTAIELAANYPNKVNTLILASAISKKWLDGNGKTYKTAQLLFHPKIEKFTWGMVRCFSGIFPKMMAKGFYSQFSMYPMHQLNKEDVQELISALGYYTSGYGFLNDIDQDIAKDVVAKVKCPTLIIHSENDNAVSIGHARYAHETIPHSKFKILRNTWGHLFWIGKDSEDSIRFTLEFIEKNA